RDGRLTHPVGYRPSLRTVACSADVLAATPDARCEQLIVPEVRSKPAGRRIHVDVVVAPAQGPVRAPPVLLVDVNEALATSPLRAVTDVYAVTLRGLSPTDRPRLTCPDLGAAWLASLSKRADDPSAIEQRVVATTACAASLRRDGVQLEGYTM